MGCASSTQTGVQGPEQGAGWNHAALPAHPVNISQTAVAEGKNEEVCCSKEPAAAVQAVQVAVTGREVLDAPGAAADAAAVATGNPAGAEAPSSAPSAEVSGLVSGAGAGAIAAEAATQPVGAAPDQPSWQQAQQQQGGPAVYGLPPTDMVWGWNEQERLAALRSLGVVRQPSGPRFGAITDLLRTVFEVPSASVVLMEEAIGLTVPEMPEDTTWPEYQRCEIACKWVVGQQRHELVVSEDMTTDPRFNRNPFVTGPPYVRFYASVPLASTDQGLCYGTLCVVDTRPRCFPTASYQMLVHLAEVVVRELEGGSLLRWRQLALEARASGVRRLVRGLDCFTEGILLCDVRSQGWAVCFSNQAFSQLTGLSQPQAAAAPFWHHFSIASRGGDGSIAPMQTVQQAVAEQRPFTLLCQLKSPAPAGGSTSSGGGSGTGGPHRDVAMQAAGSAQHLEANAGGSLEQGSPCPGSAFKVTITPSTARQFRPDEPLIGIPAFACGTDNSSGTDGNSGSDGSNAWRATDGSSHSTAIVGGAGGSSGYWFATFQPAAALPPDHNQATAAAPAAASTAAEAEQFAPASASAAARSALATASCNGSSAATEAVVAAVGDGIVDMLPEELKHVQLGPLLGVGACGRAYRGMWHGSSVAVKVLDLWDPPAAAAVAGAATTAAASVAGGQDGGDTAHTTDFTVSSVGGSGASSVGNATFDGVATASSTSSGSGGNSASRVPIDDSSGGGPTSGSGRAVINQASMLEALLSRVLKHPHIVPTHGWGIRDGEADAWGQRQRQIWIVQTLCTMGTLMQGTERGLFRDPTTQGPNLHFILLTLAEVAGALAHLHNVELVHGDLTGNNVLLTSSPKDARKFVAQVCDFGLSRPHFHDIQRSSFGTVSHMAPELLTSDELSPAADSYSLGVCIWEMMSGVRAWRCLSPVQIVNAVTVERRTLEVPACWPAGIRKLVESCLSLDPGQRPSAAEALAQVQGMLQQLKRQHAASHQPSGS